MLAGARRRWGTSPYEGFPSGAPYNCPTPATTPTPDGSGQATHPSVVNFPTGWNGWRYWMALTPYAYSNDHLENPCILVSADGYQWQEPAGITNPIYPWSGIPLDYNSDTELVYDPECDRLICYWRPVVSDLTGVLAKTSTDGVTWSDVVTVVPVEQPLLADLSPCIVRRAAGDWWMFSGCRSGFFGFRVRRSADPLTGWSAPARGTVPLATPSHQGIVWADGQWWGLAFSAGVGQPLIPIASSDGYAWTAGPAVAAVRPGEWDNGKMYRPCLTVKGAWFRVWYGAMSTASVWGIGYTRMPRSLWPAPPA